MVSWPGSAEVYVLDVTIRSPDATGRAKADGTTSVASRATYDKHHRYGAMVTPIIVSHRGRVPKQTRDALVTLSAESRRWAVPKLGARPGVTTAALQLALEVAAVRAVADAHLLSLGAQSAAALGWQLAKQVARQGRAQHAYLEATIDLQQVAGPMVQRLPGVDGGDAGDAMMQEAAQAEAAMQAQRVQVEWDDEDGLIPNSMD